MELEKSEPLFNPVVYLLEVFSKYALYSGGICGPRQTRAVLPYRKTGGVMAVAIQKPLYLSSPDSYHTVF